DGNTYTANNNTATYTIVGGNSVQCDSIVTLNLTIKNKTYGTDTQEACETYTWIDGNTYTASNSTATYTLTNIAGCDSIVTLNLTIKNKTYGTDTQEACETFTWIDGITYTASNSTATYTLTNIAGCDSIVTLNLTITGAQTSEDITICDKQLPYLYRGLNLTAGGTYIFTTGCDTHTLNLEVVTVAQIIVTTPSPICADDGYFMIYLDPTSQNYDILPSNYTITFEQNALNNGFVNQSGAYANEIRVDFPASVYPDSYKFTITFYNNITDCGEQIIDKIDFDVYYPSSIMQQKWDDVIALKNSYYNGGYDFAGYQWYKNDGEKLVGQTHSYIYLGDDVLNPGDEYYVLITRADASTMFSCPLTATEPKPSVSEFPTIVKNGNIVTIFLTKDLKDARLWTVTGILLEKNITLRAPVHQLALPQTAGVYLLEIRLEDERRQVYHIPVE
ncbi:MAG: hypothetical protein LBN95_04105, partial [Prevotellaceae bacterium]|nr:hypothetical protein [Prevotellaceae bacterium]